MNELLYRNLPGDKPSELVYSYHNLQCSVSNWIHFLQFLSKSNLILVQFLSDFCKIPVRLSSNSHPTDYHSIFIQFVSDSHSYPILVQILVVHIVI